MSGPNPPSALRAIGLIALFGARQVCWTRRTIFVLLLVLLPAILAVLIRAGSAPGSIEMFRRISLPMLHLFLIQLLCLFYAGSVVRDAIDDHSIGFLLTRPIGRGRVVSGLYLGVTLFTLPLGVISAFASHAVSRAGLPGGIIGEGEIARGFFRLLLVHGASVPVYAAIYLFLGLAVKHPTILGLVLMIVIDWVIGTIPGSAHSLAPSFYFESLLSPWYETRATLIEGPEQAVVATPGKAWMTIAVLLGVVLLLTLRLARRKDFLPPHKTG